MRELEIMSTSSFDKETYRCSECRTNLDQTEVTDEWKCIHCGSRAIINAPNLSHEIMRKLPSEVTKKDMFFRKGELYDIYSTSLKKNGNFQFNLKEFGAYEQDKYTFANVLVIHD